MSRKLVDHSDPVNPGGPQSFAGYPKTFYHPVQGKVEVANPDEENRLTPKHDYFATPEEADAHRTDREAGEVVLKNVQTKLAQHEDAKQGVVRNSVQAQESVDSGRKSEPL